MHGDAVSLTFAIGCCSLQNKQHASWSGQFTQCHLLLIMLSMPKMCDHCTTYELGAV